MVRPLLITGLVLFGMVSVSAAQSSSATSGSSTSGSSTSGQQDGSTPQAAAQAQTKSQDPSAAENKKKPKKVWTNEDVGSKKDGVSVVGAHEGGSTSSSCSSCAKPADYERLVLSYREKLEPLRANLGDIDRKIQAAKEAKGNASEDTAAWIKVYDGKRKDVLAKMERIEDEARRAGVLPGDLRE
jgi:hypothetical protein